MRAMICQSMSGKTDEEIINTRDKAVQHLLDKGLLDREYEIVDTFFTDEWYSSEAYEKEIVNRGLFFLAKSLEKMSMCDIVYFCKGWEDYRGCRIEYAAATNYGLDIVYEEHF